ncbi:cytochrome c-type biogenesis protein [Rhizobium sp.]
MEGGRAWLRRFRSAIVAVMLAASFTPALAVNPDEILADPVLEARARAISAGLRCMVCQNQSIDDSNAELAKDLRLLVRDRLRAGDSDRQVMDYIVSRYGEFVLLKPPLGVNTVLLWGMPAALLVVGGIILFIQVSRRRRVPPAAPLSAEEERQLGEILAQRDDR